MAKLNGTQIREKAKHFCDKQQLFSGIIGALLTVIVGLFSVPIVLTTNYVSVESFDVLINKYFVNAGLVSEDILEMSVDEQFQAIAHEFSINKSTLDGYDENLKNVLTLAGMDSEAIEDMSTSEIFSNLSSQIEKMKFEQSEFNSLQEENSILKRQTTAKVMTATLVVDGEKIDINIPNSLVNVNGHLFYSETLLNSFLDEQIIFDDINSIIYYGTNKADKIPFQSDMITDISGFNTYAVENGRSFTMGTDIYVSGLVSRAYSDSFFYANLKREYSKMSFVVGHIDGTGLHNATIYVYTKNGNEQYRLLKSYDLTSDMFPEEKSLDINYADGIQIVIDAPYDSQYALADIYLYR